MSLFSDGGQVAYSKAAYPFTQKVLGSESDFRAFQTTHVVVVVVVVVVVGVRYKNVEENSPQRRMIHLPEYCNVCSSFRE